MPLDGVKRPQVVEDLENAANHMEEVGFTQGVFKDYITGGVCMLGALAYTCFGDYYIPHDDDQRTNIQRYFTARLAIYNAIGTGSITDWKDFPGRTKEEVLLKFKEAINLYLAKVNS